MSRFNTIKKSRKRSHEIDEKLNVLNRELEKTKDIREIAPTMSTGGLYTPVQQSLPQDPVQVPNPDPSATGPTTDDWTQPTGDGEDGGTAGTFPTSFPKIWNNPGYQDGGAGFYGANGEPLYSEDDLNYTIPPASETGGVAALGGMQRERLGTDPRVVTGYLRRDVSVNAFVDTDDGFIEHNGVTVTFKTHPELFKPVNYWVTFSIFNPHIDAYWPNNSAGQTPQYTGVVAGSEDSNPRALLTVYKYVGGARTQIFDPVGSRGGTTAGDPKGTGDPDQYPPLPFGPEAFNKLNDEADQDIAFPPAAILAAMAALGIAFKGAQSAWKMYQKYKQKIDEKMKQMKVDGTQLAGSLSGRRIAPGTGGGRSSHPGAGWKWDQSANGGQGAYLPDLDFYLYRAGFEKASYEPKGNVLSENAYMALLHRDYRPNEQDYVKYGAKTPEERKIFDAKVKKVLAYAKKRPDRLEYVMKRYPKNDPRLSMLNYKMDNMTEASDEYLEKQFPTNQALFTKVKERTKKNMNLTDPKNFKPVKDPIKYVDVKNAKKLKETVTRHFNKPVKSKSMFGLSISKVKKKNQKMIEKREKEQQIKDDENAYINEKMSRQKSNWKYDLTEV
jgi:hypothetical protein